MIYVTGDTHADIDIHKFNSSNLKSKNISFKKDDYVIILGDFGLPFLSSDIEKYNKRKGTYYYWINWLKNKDCTFLFVDGNHDNHAWWSTIPTTKMFNGKVQVHPHASNVIHLMRGQVYTIENQTFFVMGGATSIDKAYRTENVSWWKEELPSSKEYELAIYNLEKNNFKVDYVLTHTCGSSYLYDLLSYTPEFDELNRFFNYLEFDFKLDFKHWYFGHFHQDRKLDNKHTCLYDKIIQLD